MEDPNASSNDRFRIGVMLAIAGTFLFALKSIFIKLAFAAGATPTLLLSLRMLFALPFYLVVFWRIRNSDKRDPLSYQEIIYAFGLGFFGYYLASYLDLSGLSYISAQLERLTLFTYPTIIAVLAWFFLGEPLGRRILAAIFLCYLGVFLMYGQEKNLTEGANLRYGVFLVLGSAISYSLYVVFAKPTMQRIGSRQFTCLAMLGSTFFITIHFLSTHELQELRAMSPIVYAYALILAFVCTVLPSFMINEAIVRIGATRTTVIGSIGPVLTMLLAILILGEPSSVQHFVGMLAAIIGVSLVINKKS